MNKPAPFQVTPAALKVLASLSRQHPELRPALTMIRLFEELEEWEQFMMAYDTPDKFSKWPRVDLCGDTIPISPDALERLSGRTLALEAREVVIAGEKESLEFLVAA